MTAKMQSPAVAGALGRKQPKPKAANKIVSSGGVIGKDRRPANAIRKGPKSPDTRLDVALRDMFGTIRDSKPKINQAKKDLDKMNREMSRSFARPYADRLKGNVDARLSTMYQQVHGGNANKAGKDVIRRRAERAAKAAARGSKAGEKALRMYDAQLAQMPQGKSKNAANNITAGRANTTKEKRKKRKPKK